MTEGTNTPAARPDGGLTDLSISEISIDAHMEPGGRVEVRSIAWSPGSERFRVTFGNYHRRVTVYLPENLAVQLLAGLGAKLYGTPEQTDDAPAAQS